MKSRYNRLTYEQRIIISKLIQLGYTQQQIAIEIGCHKSSISREISRVPKGEYVHLTAHHSAVSSSLKRRYGKCKILFISLSENL